MKRNLPSSVKRRLKQVLPQFQLTIPSLLMLSDIDWERTKAYAMEVRPNIWINLQGREPRGIVTPGQEYEAVREEIADRLRSWRDPIDGQSVVQRVFKREELFHGPHFERTPDLLLQLASPRGYGYQARPGFLSKRTAPIETSSDAELVHSLRPNASHALDGIFLLQGPGIKAGTELPQADIMDIAPTVLYLMDEPIPEDMDGSVIESAFDSDYLTEHPIKTEEAGDEVRNLDVLTYDDEEESVVEERLRGLGYLD